MIPPLRAGTRLELSELRITREGDEGVAVKKIKVEKILATATAIEY
jgi:hypothetical protein